MADDLEASRVNLFLHAENVRFFGDRPKPRLPVTIVSGFLGAGKTTLLRHLLSNKSNLRIAAAINDFAELNIDEDLVASRGQTQRVVELSNGCVCCSLISDLEEAVCEMLSDGGEVELDKINYLVLETSGVSDPMRIIKSLDAKFGRMYRARLDSVVTVVDADHLASRMGTADADSAAAIPGAAARSQLACADVVLLNKVDLLDSATCDRVEEAVRTLNPLAAVHRTTRCRVPLHAVFDVAAAAPDVSGGGGPITHEGTEVPVYVSATGGALRTAASAGAAAVDDHAAPHLAQDRFMTVSLSEETAPLRLGAVQHLLRCGLPKGLVRFKAILWLEGGGEGDRGALRRQRSVVHLSGRGRLGFEADGVWAGPPMSSAAFIGKELDGDALAVRFSALAAEPEGKAAEAAAAAAAAQAQAIGESPLFELAPAGVGGDQTVWFRLTGEGVYGYSPDEIRSELRIDLNQLTADFVDAVNASTDAPKAFLCHAAVGAGGSLFAVHAPTGDPDDPASDGLGGNPGVLDREARAVLSIAFRNVTSCKCGV